MYGSTRLQKFLLTPQNFPSEDQKTNKERSQPTATPNITHHLAFLQLLEP